MPAPRVPHRSGVHRLAAIALYRALLTQCRALSLPFASPTAGIRPQDELQNIVRHRFKHARFSQSARQLRFSFDAGYEALDHLDASIAGDESRTAYIAALLQRAPARLKSPPIPKQPRPTSKQSRPVLDLAKESSSLFRRPLPLEQLSGNRHVPVLFNANGIPVLRIKKPQPSNLSGYITNRIKARQAKQDRLGRLHGEQSIAVSEDEWDFLVPTYGHAMAQHSVLHREEEPGWVDAVQDAIGDVQRSMNAESRKNGMMAEKMQVVVDREQALFDQERADKVRERRQKERSRTEKSMAGAVYKPIDVK